MGWGILDDHRTPRPPGTVLLDDLRGVQDGDAPESSGLKKQGHVVLQPQPTDSPNDPLNWTLKVKLSVYITIVTTMVSIGGVLGMLATAGRILAEKFHVSYPTVVRNSKLIGASILVWLHADIDSFSQSHLLELAQPCLRFS
jgi:hypothetical protein